jgi:hypothetical protein
MKKITFLLFVTFLGVAVTAQWSTNGSNVYYSGGNVGIGSGTSTPNYKLQINGDAELGDSHDPTPYGLVQIVRPSNQPDNKFHLSFIRNGASVSGMGYAQNSNVLGIWHANNNQGTPLVAFTYEQRVGIGTSTPADKLTIAGTEGNIHIGNGIFGSGYNGIWLNGSTNANDYNILSKASDNNLYVNRPLGAAIFFRQQNTTQMVISSNGSVGIGTNQTADANYKLFVETGIRTRKVKVDQSPWPDYVFESNYFLPSLQEVEQFIQKNKHLPGVPTAKDTETNGLDLGDNQAVLLKKIEELTLYIIKQDKRISRLEAALKEK